MMLLYLKHCEIDIDLSCINIFYAEYGAKFIYFYLSQNIQYDVLATMELRTCEKQKILQVNLSNYPIWHIG